MPKVNYAAIKFLLAILAILVPFFLASCDGDSGANPDPSDPSGPATLATVTTDTLETISLDGVWAVGTVTDDGGQEGDWSVWTESTVTGVETGLPAAYALHGNVPDPFNPQAVLASVHPGRYAYASIGPCFGTPRLIECPALQVPLDTHQGEVYVRHSRIWLLRAAIPHQGGRYRGPMGR